MALLINSLISLFYYLRWIAQLLKTGRPITAARRSGAAVAIGSAIASLILGLAAAAVWQLFTAI